MADINKYRITASPRFRTVTPGAKITYYCQQTYSTYDSPDSPKDTCKWFCYNDRATVKKHNITSIFKGPDKFTWKDAKWTHPGHHTIKCLVTFTDNVKCYYELPQWVDTEAAVLAAFFKKSGERKPDPFKEYTIVKKYITVLKKAAKKFKFTSTSQKDKHDEKIKQLTQYRDKLGTFLSGMWGKEYYIFTAAHLEIEKQKKSALRVILVRMGKSGGKEHWRIFDWTNPTHKSLTGLYDGKGNTRELGIKNAISDWDEDNEYWPGRMMYEIPKKACGKALKSGFKTDGASFWGSVSNFFTYIAIGAAVVAGVVTLIAPVPGSRVVSGAIWTSLFSSTAAAAINIGQRRARGFGSWKDDAFDGLTIVGNVFGGVWLRCARISLKVGRSGQLAKYALIGQVATDGVQGVLISVDHIKKYDDIMADKSLSPEERTKKLVELFRSLALAGTMTYISIKGSKADLDNLKAGKIDTTNLNDLKNPDKTVKLTETPTAKGHTSDKTLRAKVRDEQIRQSAPAGKVAKTAAKAVKAKPPAERGMRPRDHHALTKAAQGSGNIIVVRNSNPAAAQYIGKKGYKPKTEKVKCKSRKTPPNEGLAAADPTDPKLAADLANKKPPVTYEAYKKSLEKDGFEVMGKSEGYIIRDKQGNAYYSDYDLHGVYKDKTGKDAYSESVRKDLNRRFGEDLVQHGPHDNWEDRLKDTAGRNKGPQGDSTAYLPDGSSVHLATIADMKAFYKKHGINWDQIWKGQY